MFHLLVFVAGFCKSLPNVHAGDIHLPGFFVNSLGKRVQRVQ